MDTDTLFPVLAGIVRHFLTTFGGALVAGGYMQSSDLTAFVGGGMIVAGVIWSWWQKKGQQEALDLLRRAKSPAAKVVVAFLMIGFVASFAFPARAAQSTPTPADVVTNLIKNINNIALADLQNAQALANAMPNKVTAPCWTAVVNMVQKQQAILNPPASTTSSSVPPLPSVHIFTDAEKLSEIIQSLQTGGDIQINCAAMADASKKSVLQIVSAIISGASVAPLIPVVP